MTDGLATTLITLVVTLSSIAFGVAWWVNRPRRADRESAPRIQPLFSSDLSHAIDDVGDDEPMITAEQPAAPSLAPSLHGPLESKTAASDADGIYRFAKRLPVAESGVESSSLADDGTSGLSKAAPTHAASSGAPQDSPARPQLVPPSEPALPASTATPSGRPLPGPQRPLRGASPSAAPRRAPAYIASPFGHGRGSAIAAHDALTGGRPEVPTAPAKQSDTISLRFSIPTDGTLQFLPGRLEIISGQDAGREVRFVRLPDSDGPEITFGRTEGAPYRHVQLRDPTVSRMHARMRLRDGRWTLTNLSTTNPVTYNGRILEEGEDQTLDNDDRIEMGEVSFRFRNR